MRTPSRQLWLLAVVFGLPTGVGVYLAGLRVLGTVDHGLAVLAGVVTAVGLGGAVLLLGVTGEVEQ